MVQHGGCGWVWAAGQLTPPDTDAPRYAVDVGGLCWVDVGGWVRAAGQLTPPDTRC